MATLRVLVVDDNPLLLDLLGLMLQSAGYEVATARSASEALDRIGAAPPEVVLVDWMMPNVDGVTFCQQIQRLKGRDRPALILMSADDRVREHAEALGVAGALVKPFDFDQLIARVDRCCRPVQAESASPGLPHW